MTDGFRLRQADLTREAQHPPTTDWNTWWRWICSSASTAVYAVRTYGSVGGKNSQLITVSSIYSISIIFSARSCSDCFSSLPRNRCMENAMNIITGMLISSRARVNLGPMAEYSNISRGILVVDQAPMNMNTLVRDAPFLTSMAAMGKAT